MNAAAAPAQPQAGEEFRREFVEFAILAGVLRFGEFRTKAGRLSPYFFNAGLFSDGRNLGELGRYYARAALASGIGFDIIFGPAYKGITLAAATAIALAGLGHNVPFCFNRKEAKDHGEGGNIVGAPLQGRVMLHEKTRHWSGAPPAQDQSESTYLRTRRSRLISRTPSARALANKARNGTSSVSRTAALPSRTPSARPTASSVETASGRASRRRSP